MTDTMKFFSAIGFLTVLSCLLTACGGETFHYVDDAELKPGPGVFSGKDGEFTLYKKEDTAEKTAPEQEKREKQ